MTDYRPPDPAIAQRVYQRDRESAEQYRRLEPAQAQELRRILLEPGEPVAARANALLLLLQRQDPQLAELLPRLFEEDGLGHLAISYCPISAPEVVERLRALLDHPQDRVWSLAAGRLARAKEQWVRPRLLDWFHRGDQGHRNVAVEGLMRLDPREAAEVFRGGWEDGGRDEEDRLVLAAALLRLGETCGLPLLQETARGAKGAWAVFAATAVAGLDRALGLRLLLRVIDHGDLEARQSAVSHAWNMAQLPHAFTADGIHEARLWVEQQLEALASSR